MRSRKVLVLMAFSLAMGGSGCESIYHQTAAIYPPTPQARLKLAVERAQQARETAEKAAATLSRALAERQTARNVEYDIDRLEAAALDLSRRVSEAKDAAAACPDPDLLDAQLQQLAQRSTELLKTTARIRSTKVPSSNL